LLGGAVGVRRAVGLMTPWIRRMFTGEALVLAIAGSAIGIAGAIAYGSLMMAGLRTWWIGAVGTTALSLHISALSLVAGAAGGTLAALACIWWTLRSLARVTERSLLSGQITLEPDDGAYVVPAFPPPLARDRKSYGGPAKLAVISLASSVVMLGLGIAGAIGAAGAFFGAGALLLVAC